jgi:hypothetical protein
LEHLGRADAVEDIDACRGAPALAERRRQRFAGGNGKRSRSEPAPWRMFLCASSMANSVGTPKNTVGRCRPSTSNTASGVGLCGSNTVVAPTDIGNAMALPMP